MHGIDNRGATKVREKRQEVVEKVLESSNVSLARWSRRVGSILLSGVVRHAHVMIFV